MLWQVQFFPPCTHHVFLSHCREDRESLAFPTYEALRERGVIPWLDRHDYPYGRSSFEALRDGVLKSRHTVFFVTPAMLAQPRGWGILELAWADLLQDNLREAGGVLQTVMLPLFFLDPADELLQRSAWRPMCDRGDFHPSTDKDPVAWAFERICEFVRREEERGLDYARWLEQDPAFRSRLSARHGLIERISCRHPAPMLQP